jgi:hypothetical protein
MCHCWCHRFARALRPTSFEDAPSLLPTTLSLCSTGLSIEHKTITLLTPAPGPLPGRYLVIGDIKYVE